MNNISRWLINIGLTLQFYIPGLFYMFCVLVLLYPSGSGGEGAGLAMAIGIIFLALLIVTVIWCVIYLYWDRYGNRCIALGFLIASNFVFGGIWLLIWIVAFSRAIWDDPDVWLFSPAPIVVPTVFYIIAMILLMRAKNEPRDE